MLQKCGPHMLQNGPSWPFLRQGLVVKLAGGLRIERQVELVLPAKFKPGLAQRVVAVLRPGMALGQVGGVAAIL